jgi:peptide-methionine (S)-S-oxide reductase
MEPPYELLEGVAEVVSGYDGGTTPDPTYDAVANGRTDYAEAVRVVFDREVVSYEQLLDVYWRNIDPFSADGQFCDRGEQYRPAIYYLDDEQEAAAEASRERLQARFDAPFVVDIEPSTQFYAAEEYHQDFYLKNPTHYKRYRRGCGRDARLLEVWGTDADV